MKTTAASLLPIAATALALLVPAAAWGQPSSYDRLSPDLFDVVAPSEWVSGSPGEMRVVPRQCRSVPASTVRRRIVEIAVQEWAFFGFPVLDRLNGARLLPPGAAPDPNRPFFESTTRRPSGLSSSESARLAASIAGYWAVTPEGPGIVQSQNQAWNRRGVGSRWIAPWSAAFISWVMCEAGLGSSNRFRRAIAHRVYIDQGIRARDGQAPESAFVAYDIGERTVEPGDMLCSGRRPRYRSLAERRRQMGLGASTHCDIVVAVDEGGERVLAIGGNVLRSVSLKVLPGRAAPDGGLLPRATSGAPMFAHLKLRADAIEADALVHSRVLASLGCQNGQDGLAGRAAFVVSELAVGLPAGNGC